MEGCKASSTEVTEEILECVLRLVIAFPPFLPCRTHGASQTVLCLNTESVDLFLAFWCRFLLFC